jgi:hypothetical protein
MLRVFRENNSFAVRSAVFPGCLRLSAQVHSSWADAQKFITLRPFVVSKSVSNHWKDEKLFYISHV